MIRRNIALRFAFKNRCKVFLVKRVEISSCFVQFITWIDFIENNLHFRSFLRKGIIHNRIADTSKKNQSKKIVKAW